MKFISDLKLGDVSYLVCSSDYNDRFFGEYLETLIRYECLHKMVIKHEAGTLVFTPNRSIDLLREQKRHMGEYLHTLEVRAQIEDIDLDGSIKSFLEDIETGNRSEPAESGCCVEVPDHPTY